MSKTLNNVVLKVHFTLAANHNTNIADYDDISTAFGKIGKYLADLKSGAFTTAYTHPTYTSKSSGLYKITVDGTGHVSAATAVTGTDLPSHMHNYIPLTGSGDISGNLKMNVTNRGFYLIDKTQTSYPGIIDNGTNLWVGAQEGATRHHVGSTFISTGWDQTTQTGNPTIKISVPNAANDGATNYLALHTGNTSFTQTQTSGNKVGTLTINNVSKDIYANDNTVLQSNSTTTNYRPIIIGTTASSDSTELTTTTTGQLYTTAGVFVKPSNGTICANNFYTTNRLINGYGAAIKTAGLNLRMYYTDSSNTTYDFNRDCIRTVNGGVIDNASLGLVVDSGGLTIVGGGESASNLINLIALDQSVSGAAKLNVSGTASEFTSFTCTSEQLVLSSDNNIFFVTKCNTITDREAVILDTTKNFHPDVTGSGGLGTNNYHWGSAYINTVNGDLVGKVKHTATTPTTSTTYGLTFHTSAGVTQNDALRTSNGIRVSLLDASTGGNSYLILGNNTTAASGGKFGAMRLYTAGTGFVQLGANTESNSMIFATNTGTAGDNIRGYEDKKYDLGTSSYKWRKIYSYDYQPTVYRASTTTAPSAVSDEFTFSVDVRTIHSRLKVWIAINSLSYLAYVELFLISGKTGIPTYFYTGGTETYYITLDSTGKKLTIPSISGNTKKVKIYRVEGM